MPVLMLCRRRVLSFESKRKSITVYYDDDVVYLHYYKSIIVWLLDEKKIPSASVFGYSTPSSGIKQKHTRLSVLQSCHFFLSRLRPSSLQLIEVHCRGSLFVDGHESMLHGY